MTHLKHKNVFFVFFFSLNVDFLIKFLFIKFLCESLLNLIRKNFDGHIFLHKSFIFDIA